jgi:hypothetical protein
MSTEKRRSGRGDKLEGEGGRKGEDDYCSLTMRLAAPMPTVRD